MIEVQFRRRCGTDERLIAEGGGVINDDPVGRRGGAADPTDTSFGGVTLQ